MPTDLPTDLHPLTLGTSKPAPKEWVLTGRHVLIMIVSFFAVIIMVNMTMMWIALRTMPGVQVKSAYEASQAFNRELDTIAAQDSRGWQVDVMMPQGLGGGPLRVSLRDKQGEALIGYQGIARFERPTDKRLDRSVDLVADGAGRFAAALPPLATGQWDLVIEITRENARMHVSRRRIQIRG